MSRKLILHRDRWRGTEDTLLAGGKPLQAMGRNGVIWLAEKRVGRG